MMDPYLPWFVLKNVNGVGDLLFKRLIDTFKSPEAVLKAPEIDLQQIKSIPRRTVKNIKNAGEEALCNAEKELKTIRNSGFQLVCMADAAYPPLLREIPDPPPVMTFLGTLENTAPAIAIVGARKATRYGIDAAFRLAHDLCRSGFQIVSGMAAGIDTAAHQGALRAEGRTLAVLGSGLANIYPRKNRRLFDQISASGAVMSEFSINAKPDAINFPRRNRIIAGISTGTIVVEAAAKSGSLITARLAAEQFREVFAVPGSINSSRSAGTHTLIRQGAKLVENKADVIEELHHLVHLEHENRNSGCGKTNTTLPDPDPYQKALLNILEPYPLHVDTIIEKSGLDSGGIMATLLDMEIQGVVKQDPGKLFYIIEEQNWQNQSS
ncbi:MAG TPA: DNA-processing protein DprA [Desulfobacteraceae bacterium]|nr:DNA-processing protein DprA [Desulfobacteraceae bacterium]